MADDNVRPKVGLGLLLIKNGHILLSQRMDSHGVGEYSLTGGHLENGESFEECSLRELHEEAGDEIVVTMPKFLCVTNLTKYAPKHYVDIGMVAEWVSGEPINSEPQKRKDWQWFPLNNLPEPLFGCTLNYIEAYKTGRAYFENA